MNIGLIGVNDKPTTKMACGGTEVFVSDLAEELVNRGHKVTILQAAIRMLKDVGLLIRHLIALPTFRN